MIFILGGIMMGYLNNTREDIMTWDNFGKSVLLYFLLHAIRLFLLLLILPVIRNVGYPMTHKHMILLTWGALRGALGLFLSLLLTNNDKIDPKVSGIILFHSSFIAMFTLIINGNLTGALVSYLKLS
jgi:CPA1 family monovalent cation:H+ antiporter